MQPISQTIQMDLYAAEKIMYLLRQFLKGVNNVDRDMIDDARKFCDLVENAILLDNSVTKYMYKRGGGNVPIKSITIHSDVARSVAKIMMVYNATS